MFIIVHWSVFNMVGLQSLSENAGICVMLVLVFTDHLSPFSLRFSWFWEEWFSVETWTYLGYIMGLWVSCKPCALTGFFWHHSAGVWRGLCYWQWRWKLGFPTGPLLTPAGRVLSSQLGEGWVGVWTPNVVSADMNRWLPPRGDPVGVTGLTVEDAEAPSQPLCEWGWGRAFF